MSTRRFTVSTIWSTYVMNFNLSRCRMQNASNKQNVKHKHVYAVVWKVARCAVEGRICSTKISAIRRMKAVVKKIGSNTLAAVYSSEYSRVASNGTISPEMEKEMKSWFYMQKEYPKRIAIENLGLSHKKREIPSTRSLIIQACNEVYERSYHCLNGAPVYVSSRNDTFCLTLFLFRGRVGRWIISTRKSDMLRDAGWIKSGDKRKDPTLVKKWEVYDGSNWIRSARARVFEVSKRSSWRPDLNLKRDVSHTVRQAARRSVYTKYGKRGLKNSCFPADFVLKRIKSANTSSFGFVVTKDLVVIAVTSDEAQDSGLTASAQITHVNGVPVNSIEDLERETKGYNDDASYTFRALTSNRVMYLNRQSRNLWSEVEPPSEMIKWKFHVSLLNSRCHGRGHVRKDTGHRIYCLFNVVPLYHPDYISNSSWLANRIPIDTEVILGQLPSVHVLRMLQRRRGLTCVLSAVEPFELAHVRDEITTERNELENSFAEWQKKFCLAESWVKQNIRGVSASHLSRVGGKLTGSSDTRLIDMLEPTNVTYGTLREFKLHLSSNEDMEGPLGQLLCEMKDFARAEYKLLCFGAFFAIDHLLQGRRVSNLALVVGRLGEKHGWKDTKTCHRIFSFLWKDLLPCKGDKKDVMYVAADKNLDFVVTTPGVGNNFHLPPTRRSPLPRRRVKSNDSSGSSYSLTSTMTRMLSGGRTGSWMTDDLSGSEFDNLTPLTPDIIDGIQSQQSSSSSKSSHKSAKIAATFAAVALRRDECMDFDHRVPSVFCHCKAGKGRGATITAAVILSVHLGGENREPVPYGRFDASKIITPAEVVYHIKRYRFHINVDGPKIQDLTLAYLHFLGLSLSTVDMFAKVMKSNAHAELLRLHYRIVGKQQHEPEFETSEEEDLTMKEYNQLIQDYYTMACLLQFDSRSDDSTLTRDRSDDLNKASDYDTMSPSSPSPLRRGRIQSASTRELLKSMRSMATRTRSNAGAVVDDAFSNHLSPLTKDMMTSNPPFHREVEICFTYQRSVSLISMVMAKHDVYEAGQVFLAPFYLNGETRIRVIAMTLDGNRMRRFWLKMTTKQHKKSPGNLWRPRNKGVVKLHGLDGKEILRLRLPSKLWNDWIISVRLSRAWSQNVRVGFDTPMETCRREDGHDGISNSLCRYENTSSPVVRKESDLKKTSASSHPTSPLMMSQKSHRRTTEGRQKIMTNVAARLSAKRRLSTPSPMSTPPGVVTTPSSTMLLMGSSISSNDEDTLMNRMLRSEDDASAISTPPPVSY